MPIVLVPALPATRALVPGTPCLIPALPGTKGPQFWGVLYEVVLV